MSVEAELFVVGARRHDDLLRVLGDLEQVQAGHPDARYPDQAMRLQAGIWDFLKAYGRRTERGVVDEEIIPLPKAWRPGDDNETGVDRG